MDTTSLRWRARNAKASESEIASVRTFEDDTSDDGDVERKGLLACSWLDGFATGAVVSSIFSIQQHNILTKIAAGSTFLIGPYAAYQRRRLRELGGIRKQQNGLREQTNQYQVQNEVLHRKLSRLDYTVANLQNVENEISLFAKDKSDIERLQQIIHRQNEINIKMKACLRQQILTDIMQVVVNADRDRDFVVEGPELEMLIFRMRSIPGVVFHEHRFRAKVSSSGALTLSSILEMIRHLMADDDESNDIFSLKPQDLTKSMDQAELV
mmetsp:Transcript_23211/g.35127  ORF Transcript_23211/g.35127 Transcript_23211/m.35127 type:complete len:268 (-) Transcript_23211:3185-3988(-)